MTLFDEYCDRIAALPAGDKASMIDQLTADILPALEEVTEDGAGAVEAYVNFILCAVASDGKLAEEEYLLLKPLFDDIAGEDATYEDALDIFKAAGLEDPENYKKAVDLMVDIIGEVSEELKYDIITLCLLVCAIDGEVTEKEKEWIGQLADDNFGLTPMEQIEAYLDESKTFVLATEDGLQPRMRVLGFKCKVDGKLWFAVGTFKEVYEQLLDDPKCEILAANGATFLRWDGIAVFKKDPRFMEEAAKAMPQVVEMYRQMGATLAFFTLENGSAEIVSVTNEKKVLF